MEVIALAPAFVAAFVVYVRSPTKALLAVYLPVLLLLPGHLRLYLEGLPDPGFQDAAILGIACMLPFTRVRWTVTWTDVLVVAFATAAGYSEYRSKGWANAQNLLIDMVCRVILPYLLVRILVQPRGRNTTMARTVVVLLGIVAVGSAWQFRMGSNPVFERAWAAFFPGQLEIETAYRLGFARITGPYGGPIHAGMILGVGVFVQYWLIRAGRWSWPLGAWALLAALLAGTLMTVSRGPWLGMAVAAPLALAGFARRRGLTLVSVLALGLLLGIPAYQALSEYAAVGRGGADTMLQESAAYRFELLDVYEDTILRRPWLGWGIGRWPFDPRWRSVDNHYILLALNHGLLTVGLLLLIILWTATRLVSLGVRRPPGDDAASMAFTLLAILVSLTVTIGTVFLGGQALPVFFVVVGWAEGLAQRERHIVTVPRRELLPAFAFRRVLT